MYKLGKELKDFHEMLYEQRCGSREKNKKYLETVLSLFLGVLLGHALGLLIF